jgi:hypothetical protein
LINCLGTGPMGPNLGKEEEEEEEEEGYKRAK